ncbi:MAG: GGDEF domain-containing protein [Chloroflexi bacterium]|nr:GGDEF domain-containing protein [Chloroflexota bacterium]
MGDEKRPGRLLRDRWGALFAPPDFENESDRLAAEALNGALWLGTILLVALVIWEVFVDPRTGKTGVFDQLAGLGILVVGHWLLRRGRLRWVGGVTVSLGWLLMSADIYYRQGLHSPNIAVETLLVFVAGLLVNGRFALGLAGVIIALNFATALRQMEGILPNIAGGPAPLTRWFVLSIYIALAAFFVTIIRRYLDSSIQRSEMSDHLYQTLLRSTSEAVVLVDLEGCIARINRRGCDLIGCRLEEVLGSDFRALVGRRYHALLDRYVPRVLAGHEPPVYEIELNTRDGHAIPVEVSSGLVLDGKGRPIFIQNILRDMSERKVVEQALLHQATHDPLTGLLNRAEFEANLERAISRAQRERSRLALLFIDIDDLKKVNDQFGHATGDELLKAAAERLARTVRSGDILARQSGDEFVILVEPLHALSSASQLAGRILAEIARPLMIGDRGLQVSCSIGISIFPHDGGDAVGLMQAADLAMYAAKRAGKNQASFTTDIAPPA